MNYTTPIPLSTNKTVWEWADWSRECRANYLFMVGLLTELHREYQYRDLRNLHGGIRTNGPPVREDRYILNWARDNVPDLPENEKEVSLPNGDWTLEDIITPLPLVMPNKHKFNFQKGEWPGDLRSDPVVVDSTIQAYRNYYQFKLKRICPKGMCDKDHDIKWSRRDMPEWLDIC